MDAITSADVAYVVIQAYGASIFVAFGLSIATLPLFMIAVAIGAARDRLRALVKRWQ